MEILCRKYWCGKEGAGRAKKLFVGNVECGKNVAIMWPPSSNITK
ncbi:Uncharacterized protein dnl_09990 [Desulfonema limicola]|uniref:Uncharacterized protein n=1 Tax=Desulfonema limicola TaxID=45656 RepID=A0A975GF33_9BACT|nr:Uncharacterized protein dnl_09990 [Desulfonema limicola]